MFNWCNTSNSSKEELDYQEGRIQYANRPFTGSKIPLPPLPSIKETNSRYIVKIKMKVHNKDLINYLRNRGITLIIIDPWIEDTIIIETSKNVEELSDLQYIESVKKLK